MCNKPPGIETSHAANLVCKLHKALYGINQAPRAWFDKLYGPLKQFGFISAKFDEFLFIKISSQCSIYFLVYVDGILIIANDQHAINSLIHNLNKEFTLKYFGRVNYFLGTRVSSLPTGGLHPHKERILLISWLKLRCKMPRELILP